MLIRKQHQPQLPWQQNGCTAMMVLHLKSVQILSMLLRGCFQCVQLPRESPAWNLRLTHS